MRALWESRAVLLREYIVSVMADSKYADQARDKLLDNAGDLGASIKPYYGFWAKGMLTRFLKTDIYLTGEVVRRGLDFNLAYIPSDFKPDPKELFDKFEMQRLFKRGYDDAFNGYKWHKTPPGYAAEDDDPEKAE
jgi:hypothetical protein